MFALDHLVVIAPDLAEGVEHVRRSLGLDMPYGGRHPEMGTHNHVLRIGEDLFLEVIAVDQQAEAPEHARWFGLDDGPTVRRAWDEGLRLRSWVVRGPDLEIMRQAIPATPQDIVRVSRGDRRWQFCMPEDGALPAGGAAPYAIDWGSRRTPAPGMPSVALQLQSFVLEHPDPDAIRALYRRMRIQNPPRVVRGPRLRYRATLSGPDGEAELN